MIWSDNQFRSSARAVFSRYLAEHSWFQWQKKEPEARIADAWNLYQRANTNALNRLILGDAKIRTNSDLLRNFGVTNAGGVGDPGEAKQIAGLELERAALHGAQGGPKVLGQGSVLNDDAWTPLLNDAFILGGVHNRQQFHWAEEAFNRFAFMGEREFLTRRDAFGAAAPQYESALSRDVLYRMAKWKDYLRSRQNFWLDGLVRVFARELIGLSTFGYYPVFGKTELSFSPSGPTGEATFEKYLNALQAVGYFANDSRSINAALGEFLFGDATALEGLSKGAAKAPGPHLLKPGTPTVAKGALPPTPRANIS